MNKNEGKKKQRAGEIAMRGDPKAKTKGNLKVEVKGQNKMKIK